MKILSVVGARPNFIKVAPLHREFSKRENVESIIVHTGQHFDQRMSDVFFMELGMPEPKYNLGISGGTHAQQTAQIMLAFEKVLDQEKPDWVIVVGDVNSTVACAMTAVKKHTKVAHVEAGLRSGDRTMPEEINRIITDSISDLLFVSEKSGVENLTKEGIPSEKVHFVGNIMIDSLVSILPKTESLDISEIITKNYLQPIIDDPSPATSHRPPITVFRPPATGHLLMTMHRPSNVDNAEGLNKILEVINGLSEKVPIVFSLHPRTRKKLEDYDLLQRLAETSNVFLTDPLSYIEFVKMMQEASLVITDSGGVQEETTYLKTPCITFRNSTERPSTVAAGGNILLQRLDVDEVVSVAKRILKDQSHEVNIPALWDGKTAKRIADIL